MNKYCFSPYAHETEFIIQESTALFVQRVEEFTFNSEESRWPWLQNKPITVVYLYNMQ